MSIEIIKLAEQPRQFSTASIEQILALTAANLREIGAPEDIVKEHFDADDPEKLTEQVAAQQARLKNHPEQYSLALEDDEVRALAHGNDFLSGDMIPYSNFRPKMAEHIERIRRHLVGPYLLGRPYGVFDFNVAFDLENRHETANQLLETSLEGLDDRLVYVPLAEHDSLEDVFVAQGFKPTYKFGEQFGVEHQLHVRKPKTHS